MKTELTEETRRTIERLEQQRCQALLKEDFTALEALLHPDLRHVHATGAIEDKAQYLASSRSRLRFTAIDRVDYELRHAGEHIVIATGRLVQHIIVRASGQEVDLDATTTQVWIREDGAWRVVQFHASRRN